MDDLTNIQQIAIVASSAFAAIAAGASWAAVFQTRRLASESRAPDLQIQKVGYPDGTIGAVVTNAGGGVARGAGIIITFPPYYAAGPIGHGFMKPGETVHVVTGITIVDGVETSVVVTCRDGESVPHAWSGDEEHRVFRTRMLRKPDYADIRTRFQGFYPAIDPDELEQVGISVVPDPPN